MRKLIATVLTIALTLSCTVTPVKQASAISNGETYTEYGIEYIYRDGYYEKQNDTIERDEYTIVELYGVNADGTLGNHEGNVWYDKEGSVTYKEVNDKVLIDKRKIEEIHIQWNGNNMLGQTSSSIIQTLLIGDTANLSVEVTPYYIDEDNLTVDWSSSDNTIATIDKNGKIKGKKAGKVTITATISPNGEKATAKLNVIKNQYKEKQVLTNNTGNITKTAYYDKNGNLKCKISYRNKVNPGYKAKNTITNIIYLKGKVLKKFTMDVSNVKKNKTKTKTYTIKNVKSVTLMNPTDFSWVALYKGSNQPMPMK